MRMTATDQNMNSVLNHIWSWQESKGLKAKPHNIVKYEIFGLKIPVFASERNLGYLQFAAINQDFLVL